MSKEYVDYLDTSVLQEKRPVTYKLLARKLGIHVNTAKQALWEYAKGNSEVQAIYCISGRLASDGSEPCLSFKLVKQADLEEKKKEFRHISGIHVYSIQPYDVKDLSVLVTASKDIPYLTLEDRVKCGVLKCSAAVVENGHAEPVPTDSATRAAPSHTSSTFKPTAPTTKPAQPPTKTIPAKKEGTEASKSLSKRKSPAEPSSTKSKQKNTQVAPKPQPAKAPVEENKKTTLRVEDIFSDDDEEMTEAQAPVEAKKEASPELKEQPMEEEKEEERKDEEEEKGNEEPKASPGKVRKKVLKKKHYTNARGFLVTEDVWEWEEVDAEEEPESKSPAKSPRTGDSKSKPQLPPQKKTGKKTSHGGEQKSLLSFWGKR